MTVEEARTRAPAPDVFDRRCPSRAVMDHVTSRWGALALGLPLDGTRRFGRVGDKMPAQTLERDGLCRARRGR